MIVCTHCGLEHRDDATALDGLVCTACAGRLVRVRAGEGSAHVGARWLFVATVGAFLGGHLVEPWSAPLAVVGIAVALGLAGWLWGPWWSEP